MDLPEFDKDMTLEGVTIRRVFCSRGSWSSVVAEHKGSEFRASGSLYEPKNDGTEYAIHGKWIYDPKYGPQFQIVKSEMKVKATKDAIVSFLSSGFIKGLGTRKAERIYKEFGSDTYKVIEEDPQALSKVKGISPAMCDQIAKSYWENVAYRKLREYLPPEISDSKVLSIYELYKEESVTKLKSDPYILIMDLDGVGFKTADKIALSLGIPKDDPRRICGAIVYVLRKVEGDGHCFIYAPTLHSNLTDLLGVETSVDVIADSIKTLWEKNQLVVEEDGAIYRKRLLTAETRIAKRIREARHSTLPPVSDLAIDMGLSKSSLEATQCLAVRTALKYPISVITGGPGTGKSTITRAIIDCFLADDNDVENVVLAAPTGKASRRMTEVTELPAKTIHQVILTTEEKIEDSLIIVDEASMLDITLADSLLSKISRSSRIIFVGDVDQLPPVGPGNFFRDLLASPCVPSVKLTLCFRQSGFIASNARNINNGQGVHSFMQDESFRFVPATKDQMTNLAVHHYMQMVEKYGVEGCVILSPMRTRSSTSVSLLNTVVQDILNPLSPGTYIESGEKTLRLHDRVMQMENEWKDHIANGDCGTIVDVDSEAKVVSVRFDSGVLLDYTASRAFSQLSLAYATTVHKSQGSEYDGCVVCCNSEHYVMLQRNLLYTAATRPKKKLVLLGDARSVAKAVGTVPAIRRNSKLRERINSV